jgi:hypothetical protein
MKLDSHKKFTVSFGSKTLSLVTALTMLNACSSTPKSHEFTAPAFTLKSSGYTAEDSDLVERSIAQAQLKIGTRLATEFTSELKDAPVAVRTAAMKVISRFKTSNGEPVTMDNLGDLNPDEGHRMMTALEDSREAPNFFKSSGMQDILADEKAYQANRDKMSAIPGKGSMSSSGITLTPVQEAQAAIRSSLSVDKSPNSIKAVLLTAKAEGKIYKNTNILYLTKDTCTRLKLSEKATWNISLITDDAATVSEHYPQCFARVASIQFINDLKNVVQIPGNAHEVAKIAEDLGTNCGVPNTDVEQEIEKFEQSGETNFQELPPSC